MNILRDQRYFVVTINSIWIKYTNFKEQPSTFKNEHCTVLLKICYWDEESRYLENVRKNY